MDVIIPFPLCDLIVCVCACMRASMCVCVCVCFQVFSGRGGMQASGDVSQVPVHRVYCTYRTVHQPHAILRNTHKTTSKWAHISNLQ